MKDNSTGLDFLFRNRKLLIIAVFLGGIIGAGVTFFMPKKYLSSAIIYPYNSHQVKDIVGNPQFGYEVETEQLMQLLESNSMRDKTIEAFNLYDYYEEDTTSLKWRSELALKYINDVSITRSKYLSIVISAQTQDPQLSADIANFQVKEVNRYREQIFEENRTKRFKNIEEKYLISKSKLSALKDSIYVIKGGKKELLYNFVESLNNENNNTKEFVNDFRLEPLIEKYIYERGRYLRLLEEYDNMKDQMEQDLPSVYSIDKAVPNHKKASPSLFKNVVVGALVFFMLVLAIRIVSQQWNSLKDRAVK